MKDLIKERSGHGTLGRSEKLKSSLSLSLAAIEQEASETTETILPGCTVASGFICQICGNYWPNRTAIDHMTKQGTELIGNIKKDPRHWQSDNYRREKTFAEVGPLEKEIKVYPDAHQNKYLKETLRTLL